MLERDLYFMRLAIEKSKEGIARTGSNPSVGCVIADADARYVISRTGDAGSPHAEVLAIEMLNQTELVKPLTLYTTLEPCCHYGKNPPCTDRIISSPIKRVVIAATDPDPRVLGNGIQILRSAGLEVHIGVCAERAAEAMRGFFTRIQKKRPWITLKLAISLDGKIATKNGNSQWLSNSKQRAAAHKLRFEHSAIMIGIGTALKDNPRLTCRYPGATQNPIRIIADTHLKIPENSYICSSANHIPTIIASVSKDFNKISQLQQMGCQILITDGNNAAQLDLSKLFHNLGLMEINEVLVEGGGNIATSLVVDGLVDIFEVFLSPIVIGNDGIPAFNSIGIAQIPDAMHVPTRFWLPD